MKFHDNPMLVTYRIPAADLTGGAAVFTYIQGPPGARGEIQLLQTTVTTAVTVAAAAVLVGIAGDTDKFISHSVAVSSLNTIAVSAETNANTYIDKDTSIQIGTDGAATLGAADINLCIAWERL